MAHAHAHGHPHDHAHGLSQGTRLRFALILTAAVAVLELTGGFLSGSLALLSDAAHVSMDAFALVIALAASIQATRPATHRHTFGYARVEVLAALANGGLLFAITALIVFEAVHRFASPELPQGGLMAGVAAIGFCANVAIGLMLMSGARDNINVKAALFHVASDAIGAFAVVIGGIVVLATRAAWIDPALSLLVAAIIVVGVVRIVREACDVLLESAPRSCRGADRAAEHALAPGRRRRARPARLDDRSGFARALRARTAGRCSHQRSIDAPARDRRTLARGVLDRARHDPIRMRELCGRRPDRLHAGPLRVSRSASAAVGRSEVPLVCALKISSMESKAVILASARTPFGRLGGALASLPATVLGGEAIRAALERSGLDPSEVEHVIMGMVLQGGAGQAPSRQAAL